MRLKMGKFLIDSRYRLLSVGRCMRFISELCIDDGILFQLFAEGLEWCQSETVRDRNLVSCRPTWSKECVECRCCVMCMVKWRTHFAMGGVSKSNRSNASAVGYCVEGLVLSIFISMQEKICFLQQGRNDGHVSDNALTYWRPFTSSMRMPTMFSIMSKGRMGTMKFELGHAIVCLPHNWSGSEQVGLSKVLGCYSFFNTSYLPVFHALKLETGSSQIVFLLLASAHYLLKESQSYYDSLYSWISVYVSPELWRGSRMVFMVYDCIMRL